MWLVRRVSRVVPRRVTGDASTADGAPGAGERELNRGVEMAAVVGVVVVLGLLLDRVLGTTPWCTVVGTCWAIVAQFLKLRYAYAASIDAAAARRASAATAHQRGAA